MKKLVCIVVFFGLFGCQDVKRPVAPENLILEETMVAILADAYLINAARSIHVKNIRDNGIKLDSFLYKKYQIDSLQFAKSNAYYTTDLNTYNDIFQKAQEQIMRLQKKEDTIENLDKEEGIGIKKR